MGARGTWICTACSNVLDCVSSILVILAHVDVGFLEKDK